MRGWTSWARATGAAKPHCAVLCYAVPPGAVLYRVLKDSLVQVKVGGARNGVAQERGDEGAGGDNGRGSSEAANDVVQKDALRGGTGGTRRRGEVMHWQTGLQSKTGAVQEK